MFECTYCNLIFDEKKLLVTHQKTKKCTIHREIGFVCQKCFKHIKGYANILQHVADCQENLSEDQALVTALVNQLSSKYEVSLQFEDSNSGIINFKRIYRYTHPNIIECGVNVPQKPSMFQKVLNKHVDKQIMGGHGCYLNDVFHKMYRLSDAFQFMSVRYDFETFLNVVWFDSSTVPCFHIKDNDIYVLGKVQCQNENNQKWFGDTFILKDGEKIVKCVWYKDADLKRFFINLKVLLKDLLNLYLNLGNWALKHKKIKLSKQDLRSSSVKVNASIYETMCENNFGNLVDNIKKLNSYETFYPIFKNLVKDDMMLHSNIEHVFKEELLDCSWGEEFSLMNMNDLELTGNYYCLMYYILPDSEKNIFISKE
jgi:hypothetical protein